MKQTEKDALIDLITKELKTSALLEECLKYEQLAGAHD